MERTLKDKRVLVTGANGYIGKHLTRRLILEGARVYGIGLSENYNTDINFIKCDISDGSAVKTVLDSIKPQGIFHLAAYGLEAKDSDINKAVDINIKGTVNLIEGSSDNSNLEVFINTGSEFEYGNKDKVIFENDVLEPLNEYSTTKAAATLISHSLAQKYNIPIITLRLFSIYGGFERTNRFMPYIINCILEGKTANLTGCEQIRDYMYIEDVVDAYIHAYKFFSKKSEIVNICTNNPVSLKTIVEIIENIINKPCKINFGALPYRQNEMWKLVGDNRKARELIKWIPKTEIRDGLEKTIEFYRRETNEK